METLTLHTTADRIEDGIVYRNVQISLKTRIILWFMKLIMRPMLASMCKASPERLAKIQLRVASMKCDTGELPLTYDIVGQSPYITPGHIIGSLDDTSRRVILWLHGGAFFIPAAPTAHIATVAKLCRKLNADAFMPDYRLAPLNPFPRGLDDCENAYRALLELGYSPANIVLGGDSAGGNLTLGLLQRIRKAGLPMPACAIPVSPVTELGRVQGPPAHYRIAKSDPLLPMSALVGVAEIYCVDHDTADPELSPMYMDCSGLPPMFFTASDNEILMDDSVMLVRRMQRAGIDATCHVWPILPHAYPLFANFFPEAATAVDDIASFAEYHLASN